MRKKFKYDVCLRVAFIYFRSSSNIFDRYFFDSAKIFCVFRYICYSITTVIKLILIEWPD